MTERRRSHRKKSFLRGRIYFNNHLSSVDCLVRDISEKGARLIFSDSVAVPDGFDLHIPQKDQTLHARAQWRHGEEMGIAFETTAALDHPGEPEAADDDLVTRVARLEEEVVALRRLLRKIKSVVPGADEDAA